MNIKGFQGYSDWYLVLKLVYTYFMKNKFDGDQALTAEYKFVLNLMQHVQSNRIEVSDQAESNQSAFNGYLAAI